ncbi:type II toxin-antitoxin system Phd/YefM family antitoxin, partial [Acidithiobacillus sp.]
MNINASEFKAKCLKLIDEVATTHELLVISKGGKPLVKLVPIVDETPKSM